MFEPGPLRDETRVWASLSQTLGRDILLTQASGGNTSVKMDDHHMVVKASGLRLGEVTAEKGWVAADFQNIRRGVPELEKKSGAEAQSAAYQSLLASSTLTQGSKISLEAGLHALLPDRWVAHVHSVAGQILGLMPEKDARSIVDTIFGHRMTLHFAPPSVPGHELCQKVKERISNGPIPVERRDLSLWVLQNHGLAWGTETDQSLLSAVSEFEGVLRNRFGLHHYSQPQIEPLNLKSHPAPEGKTWYRAHLSDWPACRFDTTPLLTDFVGHFDLWANRPPDFVQADDRTAHILASSPREMEGHAQVFFAHALVSTIAHQEGWFHPLPTLAVHAIKLLLLERPTAGY
jgi:rhamnose utilization protein RhaD (predicted bifunctional aldolase and dehydrogenase)